jgi:hypothetical protein
MAKQERKMRGRCAFPQWSDLFKNAIEFNWKQFHCCGLGDVEFWTSLSRCPESFLLSDE